MNQHTCKAVLAACAACALSACAEAPTRTDQMFGEAVRAATASQIIDPDASQNRKAPAGMEGAAARSTVDRYQKSFEAPLPPMNVFTIGMGGASGGK
jgi:hypothetical protein